MSEPYIDGSTLDQCREALRQGKQLDELAGKLRCDVAHLARLLGLPTVKPVPTTEPDLWRTEELNAVL